jgi:hypothetical protein
MRIVPDRDDSEREVMKSLPRSRPVRRSSKRAERASGAATTSRAGATAAAKKPKSAKAQASAKAKSTPTATAARAPRTTPRPRPGAAEPRRTARPKPAAAEARSVAAGAQAAPAEPAPHVEAPREPFVPPQRKVPAAGYAVPSSGGADHDSAVADLLTTTVQAAHELAQIGLDVGRAAMRSMRDRLPKA